MIGILNTQHRIICRHDQDVQLQRKLEPTSYVVDADHRRQAAPSVRPDPITTIRRNTPSPTSPTGIIATVQQYPSNNLETSFMVLRSYPLCGPLSDERIERRCTG